MTGLGYWPTPMGRKVSVTLEETVEQLTPVTIGTGDQFEPEVLAINSNAPG